MKGRLLSLMGLFLLLSSSNFVTAQESGSIPLSDVASPNALRITFSNAVKDLIKNTSKITVDLEWDLLPRSDSLNSLAAAEGIRPYKFIIRNSRLGKFDDQNTWFDDIKGDDDYTREEKLEALQEALCAVSSCDIRTQEGYEASPQKFKSLWDETGEYTKKLVMNTSNPKIKPSQYFGLLRDRRVLHALLTSQGIGYSVDIEGATPFNELPILSDGQDISWEINLYKFSNFFDSNNQPEENSSDSRTTINHYRATLKAVIKKPIRLVFPTKSTQNVLLKTRISLIGGGGFDGVLKRSLIPDDLEVQPVATIEAPFNELVENRNNSALDSAFQLVGNATLGGVATQGLLGGANNLSIVTGGLISDGQVEPIAGANLGLFRLGSDSSAGVLFGVGTDETVFLGPSFQLSAFTVSAGLRVSDDNGNTEFDAGGLLSVDVSRLISGRRNTKQLEINPLNTGGNWGIASDDISQNLAMVRWEFLATPGQQKPVSLRFTRMCDASGLPLAENKRSQFFLEIVPNVANQKFTKFIPRGVYTVSSPSGYRLGSRGRSGIDPNPILEPSQPAPEVLPGSSTNYGQDLFYSDTFELSPNSLSDDPPLYSRISILQKSDNFIVLERKPNDKFTIDQEIVLYAESPFSVNLREALPVGVVKIISLDDIRAVAVQVSGKALSNQFFALSRIPDPIVNYCLAASST